MHKHKQLEFKSILPQTRSCNFSFPSHPSHHLWNALLTSMNVSRTKAEGQGFVWSRSNFPLVNREELMLLRDPSRYEGNQAWRVHSARKSAGWFIRGTSSGSVSLEKQLFPFKLRRIASTLGCVSRGRLAFLWTRSSVVYSILVASETTSHCR